MSEELQRIVAELPPMGRLARGDGAFDALRRQGGVGGHEHLAGVVARLQQTVHRVAADGLDPPCQALEPHVIGDGLGVTSTSESPGC